MKKMFFGVILCLFLTFILISGNAEGQEIPNYKDKYVNDFAGVLDSLQVEGLRNLFFNVDQETTAEVVFVSLDTINGEDISQYVIELGSSWKVGKADKDNGLVILYVKDINRIWVSTGYGLEGILPDSKVGRLLDENYVPLRDSGNLSQGIISFSESVAQVIYDNKEEVLSGQAGRTQDKLGFISYIILFIILWMIIRFITRRGSRFWLLPLFLPSGRSSGGFGGGSGFGGSGFGGGGFGGGGAGR